MRTECQHMQAIDEMTAVKGLGLVFTIIASSTVAIPVIGYLVAADRLREPLANLKVWLQDNNTTVMSVLILVVGVVLIGKGIGGIF